jgi:hypothetical protein
MATAKIPTTPGDNRWTTEGGSWYDGLPCWPTPLPVYPCIPSSTQAARDALRGTGWLPDGIVPYPPSGDVVPVPPSRQPRGPGFQTSSDAGKAYLQSQGRWPPPDPAAQLAEVTERQAENIARLGRWPGPNLRIG